MAAGGNGALRRRFDAVSGKAEIEILVEALLGSGADVAVLGLFDLARSGLVDEGSAQTMARRFDELDAATAEVAADLGCASVDLHHHVRTRDPRIFGSDRMHCNARGHAVAAAECLRAPASFVRSSPAARRPGRAAPGEPAE